MKTSKAVILAGGRGERMIPITNLIPKPLIPIQGRPILAHQLDQLERLKFKEVYILTGYLSEAIENFCSSYPTSISIKCIATDVNFSPAERLLASREIIGEDFLLVYCDNYILSDAVLGQILEMDTELTFLVERRKEGNVEISSNGNAQYKSGPRSSKSEWVELGNINIHSQDFFPILEKQIDLPGALEEFSKTHSCGHLELVEKYWSISNFSRFLTLHSNRSTLLLDRDGVLISKMPKREYVTNFHQYQPLIENWLGLRELSLSGFDFIVATNQPGIATGAVDEEFLNKLHQKMASELLQFGINVMAVYVCPHHWEAKCDCRKPNPGMLLSAISDFELDPSKTLYIGDDDRDLKAAEAAGISGVLVGSEHSHQTIFPNVSDALTAIKRILIRVE